MLSLLERKKEAQKRKEEEADFQEKRMVLGITADENDDENDKENLIRRREMMRATRLEKESVFDEGDMRHCSRGGGDIVTRWRDKKQPSPDRVSNKTIIIIKIIQWRLKILWWILM